MTWRTGRKLGRTIYEQVGPEPSDDDHLLGLMDSSELAEFVVNAVNAYETRAITRAESLKEAADALSDPHTGPLRRREFSLWAQQWLSERANAIRKGDIS
jgi:hypothetical protein